MIIDMNTPDLVNYSVHYPNGFPILGAQSFDTETCEAEIATAASVCFLGTVQKDGSVAYKAAVDKLEVKKIKIEGAYATYKGQKVGT